MADLQLTLHEFFARAARDQAPVEVHIQHPNSEYQRQRGVCYQAHKDFLVMGPEGAPARVCLPYASVVWFRRLDDRL